MNLKAARKGGFFICVRISPTPRPSLTHPISLRDIGITNGRTPSRTRPLNSSALMVLWLKPWESKSLPGLLSAVFSLQNVLKAAPEMERLFLCAIPHRHCEERSDEAIQLIMKKTSARTAFLCTAPLTAHPRPRFRGGKLQRGSSFDASPANLFRQSFFIARARKALL